MPRDRINQEQKLIKAVGEILREQGFDQLKINKIAQQAEVNKVLIYRYFGGLEGLLAAYYKQEQPQIAAPTLDVEHLKTLPLEGVFQVCLEYILNEFRELRTNVVAQEFLKADLYNTHDERNPVVLEREERLKKIIDELASMIGNKDGRGFPAVIVSGLTLLTLYAHQHKEVMGINVDTEEGWARIETALANIFHGAYLFHKERLANLNQSASGDTSLGDASPGEEAA